MFGDWYYATIDDGMITKNKNYIVMGALESYNILKEYFGENMQSPIYLEVDNDLRKKERLN